MAALICINGISEMYFSRVFLKCIFQLYFFIRGQVGSEGECSVAVWPPYCISNGCSQQHLLIAFLKCISLLYFFTVSKATPYISNGCSHTPLWPLNVGRERIHGSETILTDLPLGLQFRKLEITVGGTGRYLLSPEMLQILLC